MSWLKRILHICEHHAVFIPNEDTHSFEFRYRCKICKKEWVELHSATGKYMNKWRLDIEADTNDGDYIKSTNYIDDEILALIRPIVEAIKNFQPYQVQQTWGPITHSHNFPYGHEYYPRTDMGEKTVDELYGHLGEEALEAFKNLVPCGDDIHTIESVTVMPIPKDVEVLL